MTSLRHYEDLTPSEFLSTLSLDWRVSEKIDGTFLEAGLDKSGIFYVKRKGGQPIYTVNEWPYEGWTVTYRIAMQVAASFIEALVKEGLIGPDQHIRLEILHRGVTNTIPYRLPDHTDGLLIVTGLSYTPDRKFYSMVNPFNVSLKTDVIYTDDGLRINKSIETQTWKIMINTSTTPLWVKARLGDISFHMKGVLSHWLSEPSKVPGFSKHQVLEISLNRKPPDLGGRPWPSLKDELKTEREELRQVYKHMVLMFKDLASGILVTNGISAIGSGSAKEGVVVTAGELTFKIVDQESFGKANRFCHIVKYWLVGGRRPARPCFLSRTKDWPKEKRLARLDELLSRYKKYYIRLGFTFVQNGTHLYMTYSGTLHQRMLLLFADVRKRIEDGR